MNDEPESQWTELSRRIAYQGRVTLVEHGVLLADGTQTTYEVDESVPFAVATLLHDGDDILLARQYRYPLRRWIFDLPGGAGQEDEDPTIAARRELEEELGIVPRYLQLLHTFYPNPGRSSWPVHLYFATGPFHVGISDLSDPSEQVRLARLPLSELDALIAGGEIVDPSLIVARASAAALGLLPSLRTMRSEADEAGR